MNMNQERFTTYRSLSPVLSIRTTAVPVARAALVAFLMTLVTTVFLVPYGNLASKTLRIDMVRQKASIGIREKVFIDYFQGILFYAERIRAYRSVRAHGFTIGLLLVLFYYLLRLALVETGRISPTVRTWTPNWIFVVAGALLVYLSAMEIPLRKLFRHASAVPSRNMIDTNGVSRRRGNPS